MNFKSIAVLIGLVCASALAQPGYNGPAKSFVAQFWKNIEKIESLPNNRSRPALVRTEIKMAETHLRNARSRDPLLDSSAMEAALARVRGDADETKVIASQSAEAKKTTMQFMSRFGEQLVLSRGEGSVDDPVALVERKIARFNAELDEFLSGHIDRETLRQYETRISERRSDPSRGRGANESCTATETDIKSVERCHSELLSTAAFWSGASRIYPNNARFAEAASSVRQRIESAGTREQRLGAVEKNVAEKTAANRIAEAVQRDSKLEGEFARVFAQSTPGYEVIRVNVTSHEWSIDRHPATGVILSRSHSASIGVKDSEGKCYHFAFVIEQPYVGNSFAASKRGGIMGRGEMLCGNIR
jgi:hypothetical protein